VANAGRKRGLLQTSHQFHTVYQDGRRYQTPFFTAFVLPTKIGEVRTGITVTRKIGVAVVRNRCKRRLREVIRRCRESALRDLSCDLVLNVRPAAVEARFEQLEDSFSRMVSQFRETVGNRQ
jgi:ribonuclease P protein component